jgi:hypothetical protein
MTESSPLHFQKARIHWNDKFLCIGTYSGHGRYQADPGASKQLLSPNVDDFALGKAIRESLSCSRFIPLEEIGEFFDPNRTKAQYEQWVAEMMQRYGYKTRRALFKQMLSCGAEERDGIITFAPSSHDRLEGWGRTKTDIAEGMIDETIAATESPDAVGAALRQAMSRCR